MRPAAATRLLLPALAFLLAGQSLCQAPSAWLNPAKLMTTRDDLRSLASTQTSSGVYEIEWPADKANMVFVPRGRYLIRGEESHPPAPVDTEGFLIDKHEVTVGQFRSFLSWYIEARDPHKFCHWVETSRSVHDVHRMLGLAAVRSLRAPDSCAGEPHEIKRWLDTAQSHKADSFPMVGISWFDAWAYSRWANKRLPTEIEWKISAQDPVHGWPRPTQSAAPEREPIRDVATDMSDVSRLGVYGLGGNAQEWCWDLFSPPDFSTDRLTKVRELLPNSKLTGFEPRVKMGRMYTASARQPYAHRSWMPASASDDFTGFRCAASCTSDESGGRTRRVPVSTK
jgi:formylglycine-generating enzyme required for sulfatase activity